MVQNTVDTSNGLECIFQIYSMTVMYFADMVVMWMLKQCV